LIDRDIVKRFPALEMLDSEPIVKVGFDAPTPQKDSSHNLTPIPTTNTFARPMAPSFVVGVEGALVSEFLTRCVRPRAHASTVECVDNPFALVRFFTIFDTQRSTLLDVYDPNATFSFSANTSIPPRARIQGLHSTLPNQKNLKWDVWLSGGNGGSRNLSRVGNVDKMARSLHLGRENVIASILGLPKTKHDIAGSPSAFCLDCWLTGSTLFVTVHGQFTEGMSLFFLSLSAFERTHGGSQSASPNRTCQRVALI
jgi:nuclear RNA export factor